jgi:hypothetical protein
VLGGCTKHLTLEAPLITEKAPRMNNSYRYSIDDVRSPFVKPPWEKSRNVSYSDQKSFVSFASITNIKNLDFFNTEFSTFKILQKQLINFSSASLDKIYR